MSVLFAGGVAMLRRIALQVRLLSLFKTIGGGLGTSMTVVGVTIGLCY